MIGQSENAGNNGHFVVSLSPYLSFVLCSTTKQEKKDSLLRLINMNDAFDNPFCVQSSEFDLSSFDFIFDSTINAIKKVKKRAKKDPIQLISLPSNSYHLKFKNSFISIQFIDDAQQIPLSPNKPSLILSNQQTQALKFTFVSDVSNPIRNDVSNPDTPTHNKLHRIGQRVKIDNKFGVIIGNEMIQFNDGSIGYYNKSENITHITYPIGSKVDAYWPADRLKLTNLASVLWPATVTNYSNSSDSYTLTYEDGAVHPTIPSIYISYPQKACSDDRNDCHILAQNQQCQLNPSFAMIHCRKSCRVCQSNDTAKESVLSNNIPYFDVSIDNGSLAYNTDLSSNSYNEASKLNSIGEQIISEYGNISIAEQYFLRVSFLGNNDAKFNLAHIYTILEREDMAVLYLYFSGLAGSLESNLALGYRHLYGYGVPKSCQISAEYYQKAGNALFGSNKPFTNDNDGINIEMIRLYDVNRRDLPIEETDEVIRFYHTHANNGDANAQMALGQLYYYGLRGFTQNFELAMHYFDLASKQNNGEAFAMLGNIYVDGVQELDIAKNTPKAVEYYKKAIELKAISGYTGMAFIYLESAQYKNSTAAFEYFKYAAKRNDLSAMFYLGLMYFNGIGVKQKSFGDAFECFMSASRRGHPQSLYYAGYMHLHGLVTAKSCKMAVELFKMAAERTNIAKQLAIARAHYLNNEYNKAYYIYSKLAIQGFEIAQSNVGWLLKRNLVSRNMLFASNEDYLDSNKSVKELAHTTAFKYFEWSATQNNADSQRIVGDYYYYNHLRREVYANMSLFEEAGIYYEMSAENTLGANAQSMFNLGYMHQYGIGKKKDFSMAKRYYDLSLTNEPNGNVACYIFLVLLYVEGFVNDFNSIYNGYFGLNVGGGHYFDYYHYYTKDLNAENIALAVLIVILIVLLWVRR